MTQVRYRVAHATADARITIWLIGAGGLPAGGISPAGAVLPELVHTGDLVDGEATIELEATAPPAEALDGVLPTGAVYRADLVAREGAQPERLHHVVPDSDDIVEATDWAVDLPGPLPTAAMAAHLADAHGGGLGGGAVASVNGRTGVVVGLAEQTALDAEAAARGGVDATLEAALAGEATARAAADTAHAGAVDPHAGYRLKSAPIGTPDLADGAVTAAKVAADVATQAELETALTNEATARAAAIAQAIADLIDSAPGALDTINELAAALGDDPNFVTTITGLIAGKQAGSATLSLLAALSTTATGRAVLEVANAAALRTLAGVVIGTDVQAFHANLTQLAGLALVADRLPFADGAGTLALTPLTAFARTLLDDADAPTARATLGIAAGAARVTDSGNGILVTDPTADLVDVEFAGPTAGLTGLAMIRWEARLGQVMDSGLPDIRLGAPATPELRVNRDRVMVEGRTSAIVPLTVTGKASQSADLQQWTDDARAVLAKVTASGGIVSGTHSLTAKADLVEGVVNGGNTGTAKTIADVGTGTIHRYTMTGNCTFTFPTAAAGKSFALELTQDATGSRLATWPGTVKWPANTAPTLATVAAHVDVLTFTCFDGTNWRGALAGANYSS